MNILPKKRWHVRTKDNIARVRRDEAQAREQERELERRKELAEKEVRINVLRGIAKQGEQTNSKGSESKTESGHVNLFADYEEGVTQTAQANKEHRKEKLEEKERYEKQIGYLMYLGQDTNETLKLQSWYEKDPKHTLGDNSPVEIDVKVKDRHDPINLFRHNPQVIQTNSKSKEIQLKGECSNDSKYAGKLKEERKKKHKLKKSKKEKHELSRSHKKEKNESLNLLRQERIRREAEERKRQEYLFKVPESSVKNQVLQPVAKRQKYNSQFNPDLAKQNFT